MLEETVPKGIGDDCRAHGGARVTGTGFLDDISCQEADGFYRLDVYFSLAHNNVLSITIG
jgi:hypothetical protein